MIWLTLGQEGRSPAHPRAGGEKPGSPSGRRGMIRLTLGRRGCSERAVRPEGIRMIYVYRRLTNSASAVPTCSGKERVMDTSLSWIRDKKLERH
jgi:hypothetical protein